MKIKLKLSVSAERKTVTINLKDYGVSEEDWWELSESERLESIREHVDELEQPYWEIDSID